MCVIRSNVYCTICSYWLLTFLQVLVVENDQGEVVREFMKDTDSINMYKTMRETLGRLFFTHSLLLYFKLVIIFNIKLVIV